MGRTVVLPNDAVNGEPSWFTVEGLDSCVFRAVVVFSDLKLAAEGLEDEEHTGSDADEGN